MSGPRRILTVFGTRPEAIKLFPLLNKLRADPRFVSRVCVSGQHRELLDQVLDLTGVVPDHDLQAMRSDQSLDALTANLLTGIGRVLDVERPDCVVIQGDTATAMAGALAAHHRKIPIAHVEAGLRSGNLEHPWPEEANRRIIGTLAALHFAPTPSAAEALRKENVDPSTIHVTGNTAIDAQHWVLAQLEARPELACRLAPLEARFAGKRIIGVTSHRRENLGPRMTRIAEAVARIACRKDVGVIFPVHPRPDIRAVMEQRLKGLANVALTDPLDFPHFTRLLSISTLMLTDSGGVQEEAPALGRPVLVMRKTTERPEAVKAGTAMLVGTDPDRIVAETARLLDDPAAYAQMARSHYPFGDGAAAARIANLMARQGT